MTPTISKVVEEMEQMPDSFQEEVLAFIETLRTQRKGGVGGRQILQFAGSIPLDDLREMEDAIEAGCERVDLGEW